MELVNINGMEKLILVNGEILLKMVMELKHFQMEINILEIIFMENHKVMENIDGKMVQFIKVHF